MEENLKNFFAICTWPHSPVRAKNLSRFQFEGKNHVWFSQVRRVNHVEANKGVSELYFGSQSGTTNENFGKEM